jgi:hypothetical protein
MARHGSGSWRGVLAAVFGLGLLPQPSAVAQEIPVLLVMPRQPSELSRQVEKLERAVAGLGGPLVLVESLARAEVVVQFVDYRRSLHESGEPMDRWTAHYKLLVPPAEEPIYPGPPAESFVLVLVGREQCDERHAAKSFARALATLLGRASRARRGEAI